MRRDSDSTGSGAGLRAASSLADQAEAWLTALPEIEPGDFDEKAALAAITALERLKRAAAGAQARLSVRAEEQARTRQQAAGLHPDQLGQGIGAQIALARLESPHRGARHLGLAKTLTTELPHTLQALMHGDISEWQATLVARETACLTIETRHAIDTTIADHLPDWGDSQTVREVTALAYAAEPGSIAQRHAQAHSARHVTLRPAPDTMCYLTALLPVTQGVAAYAALTKAADTARAIGDPPRQGTPRGKGQVMADTLVERLTGQATAPDVPVEIELLIGLDTLLSDTHTPAHLVGYGPLPAAQTRQLLRDTTATVWLRRLFTQPHTGRLVAMDSHRQLFEGQLRHLVILRDQFCRTPWCDAPIRHTDHPTPRRDHGPTTHHNAQGLCEACNYTKDAPGWTTTPTPTPGPGPGPGRHTTSLTTPTGEHYTSKAPRPP